jgi:hypothetical protein
MRAILRASLILEAMGGFAPFFDSVPERGDIS